MANKYVDHGAYGAYAATPTWGVPQDGDGTANSASTAASVGSILLNAQPSAGNLLTICGITFGATSGGTVNYTIGGTYSVTADNIAAAINAAATTVGSGVAAGTPQLRNLVYCRGPSTGAAANTVEIMARHGSTTLNYASNPNMLLSHSGWSTPPTFTQFAGGVGGCWGYFANTTTVWPSAAAIAAYGFWAAIPYVGSYQGADTVVVRPRTVNFGTVSSVITATLPAVGSQTTPLIIVVDNGTVWPADGTDSVLLVTGNVTSSTTFRLRMAASCFCFLKAGITSTGIRKLKLQNTGVNAAAYVVFSLPPSSSCIADLEIESTTGIAQFEFFGSQAVGQLNVINNALVRQKANAPFMAFGPYYSNVEINGITLANTGASTPHTAGLFAPNSGFASGLSVNNLVCDDFVAGSKLFSSTQIGNASGWIFDNPKWGNISDRRSYISQSAPTALSRNPRFVCGQSDTHPFDFFADQQGGYIEHNSGRSYPKLNSTLLDGTTKWTVLFAPATNSSCCNLMEPWVLPKYSVQNTAGQGVRTVTQQILLESNLASWTNAEIAMRVFYLDKDGVYRIEDTFDLSRSSLENSNAAWNGVDSDVTFDNGAGNQTFNRKKLVLTTAYQVAADSMISARLLVFSSVGSSTYFGFYDPELALT